MNLGTENKRKGNVLGGFLLIVFIAGIVIGIIALFSSFGTVDTGSRGLVLNLGNPTGEIKGQGFYWKAPFTESVIDISVQTQIEEVSASASSKDLQDVSTTVALNYKVDPNSIITVYEEVKKDWVTVLVIPRLQESIKATTSQYTAEELITKRGEVREKIENLLREKLAPHHILVDSANIVNFSFSKTFGDAIEKKVTAEQDALASRNRLEQIKYEAQQEIEKAKGQAESVRIVSQSLNEQPQYLHLEAIKKWDGKLPTTMLPGSSTPFITIK